MIVIAVTSAIINISVSNSAIFHEEVSFGGFYTYYNEPFSIQKDTNLHIKLNSNIENGTISLRIYSKDGETCYENSGSSLKENTVIPIEQGDWYYEFICDGQKEKKEAENGEYAVLIEVKESQDKK